jgi:uncharacterized protein YdaU (DUF1376 family)
VEAQVLRAKQGVLPQKRQINGVLLVNYYERYCGDYQRDTAHLSLAEHGAYTMLLDTYFSVEKPLPSDLPSLYRVCRAMTRLEQQAVKSIAEQFFPVSAADGFRHNQRADREIAKARPKIEAARNNGRKGGRPPKAEAFPHTNATMRKPDGLAIASGGISGGVAGEEPDGKTHLHQPQPQLHENPYGGIPPSNEYGNEYGKAYGKQYESAADVGFDRNSPLRDFSPCNQIPGISHSRQTYPPNPPPPGAAGACCKALTQLGVQGCNPHHPTLLALLNAGAVDDEFTQAARNAVARGKASFAYVLGTVKRQREEAAKLVLHHGRMPNSQELLESSNRAAAEGWVPPELREAGPKVRAKADMEAATGGSQHGN